MLFHLSRLKQISVVSLMLILSGIFESRVIASNPCLNSDLEDSEIWKLALKTHTYLEFNPPSNAELAPFVDYMQKLRSNLLKEKPSTKQWVGNFCFDLWKKDLKAAAHNIPATISNQVFKKSWSRLALLRVLCTPNTKLEREIEMLNDKWATSGKSGTLPFILIGRIEQLKKFLSPLDPNTRMKKLLSQEDTQKYFAEELCQRGSVGFAALMRAAKECLVAKQHENAALFYPLALERSSQALLEHLTLYKIVISDYLREEYYDTAITYLEEARALAQKNKILFGLNLTLLDNARLSKGYLQRYQKEPSNDLLDVTWHYTQRAIDQLERSCTSTPESRLLLKELLSPILKMPEFRNCEEFSAIILKWEKFTNDAGFSDKE